MATITSTEFQNHAGLYIEQSGKEPVVITKHQRPARVLMDFEEYERLIAFERQTYYPHELPAEVQAEFDKGFQGKPTPHLDHLMD
jgi:prevent-host-death family protein